MYQIFDSTSSCEAVSISNHFAGIIGKVDIISITIKISGIIAITYTDIVVGSAYVVSSDGISVPPMINNRDG